MKYERLKSIAAVFGWFGAYLLISIIAAPLPEGIDTAVTIIALWGLILVSARASSDQASFVSMLSHGGVTRVPALILLLAFCAGAGLNLAFGGLLSLLPIPEEMIGSYVDASAKYEDPSNVLMFTTVFLVPILEETVFRGLVGDRMGRFLPKWLAIPMASLAFAVMHGNLLWCTYAFVSGMVLTWMYFRCKSILPCISFHLAFNASNYLWAIFLPLPDESWAHILSLSLGGVICLSAEIAVIIRLKMENHK